MKTSALMLFLIFAVFYSCGEIDIENNQFINDPNHPALQNKLKTKREVLQGNDARVDYFYNESGFLTKEEVYSGTDLSLTHIYERNKNGKKTKEHSYTTSSAPSRINTYYSYEYEDGKLDKESYYRNENLMWFIDHNYENNNLVESLKYEDSKLVSINRAEYDLEGKILKASVFNSEGELKGATRYEYSQDTILIFGSGSNGIESSAYQEIYNSHGEIKEEAYLYQSPSGRRVTNRYFYNELQLLIESHHFDAGFPEKMGPLAIHKYEYF